MKKKIKEKLNIFIHRCITIFDKFQFFIKKEHQQKL